MSKWVMNFYTHKTGDQKDIDMLTTKGKLNNGKELSYACGIVVDTYKGWRQYSHGGADAGYRTYLSVLPDLKMGFIVFSNLGDFDAGDKAYGMAELFINDTAMKKVEVEKERRDSSMVLLQNESSVKKFTGYYIGEDGLPFSFNIHNNKLYYHIYDENNFLIPGAKDSFSIPAAPNVKFAFSVTAKDTIVDIITPDQLYHLNKYIKDSSQTDALLKTYTGIYYSTELDCRYGIALKDHHLWLTNAKYDDAKLNLVNRDHLTDDYWWINHLRVVRDSNGNVSGFEVNAGRINHVRFNKIQ